MRVFFPYFTQFSMIVNEILIKYLLALDFWSDITNSLQDIGGVALFDLIIDLITRCFINGEKCVKRDLQGKITCIATLFDGVRVAC